MKPLDSDAVRQEFLEYFCNHGHRLISGSSLLPENDPTLLFVNSGMAPLKSYFTGDVISPSRDLTNVQPCIRTKDIDDIGDRHHLTFFEMLGSWSIGGYFKRRAIELAFGLLTEGYDFSPRDLWVTVFEGDPALGLGADEESAAAWEAVGIARDHIVPQPAADNFWGPAGEAGPCGPCTEVFLDTGDHYGPAWQPGQEFETSRRYIEIWNAGVFMQFDKHADGSLSPLPFNSVDTGSGLERVTMVLNGLDSVYGTDLLLPVVRAAQELFGDSSEILHPHRVIADHLRASCMIMSEGVRPGNDGAGYIPRRLIRKCLTTALHRGAERVRFAPVIDAVVDCLGVRYPLLRQHQADLLAGIDAECRDFDGVVRRGLERLDAVLSGKAELSGADAFQLFATYGLPFEITQDIAAERGIPVAVDGYEREFRKHRELSREAARASGTRLTVASVLDDVPPTRFDGYTATSGSGKVLALLEDGTRVGQVVEGQTAHLVVDATPFYAESGGQVGDTGSVTGPSGTAGISDTVKLDGGQFLHWATVTGGTIAVGDHLRLQIDEGRRQATAANHSATHLLNAALREVLGPHVRQAGSLVEPERLRFDFTHPAALTAGQLTRVQHLVNTWILEDYPRAVEEVSQDEAKASGAISLEGEDYGVGDARVVSFDGVSRELCGGTHVEHTSFIGSMRIRSENSAAAGVRRINAVTRFGALEFTEDQQDTLATVASVLHASPKDVVSAAQRLAGRPAAPGSVVDQAAADGALADFAAGPVEVSAGRLDVEPVALRAAVLAAAGRTGRITALWSSLSGSVRLAVAVPEPYQPEVSAASLVRSIMATVGGSGGGSATVAQGGGGAGDLPLRALLARELAAASAAP